MLEHDGLAACWIHADFQHGGACGFELVDFDIGLSDWLRVRSGAPSAGAVSYGWFEQP